MQHHTFGISVSSFHPKLILGFDMLIIAPCLRLFVTTAVFLLSVIVIVAIAFPACLAFPTAFLAIVFILILVIVIDGSSASQADGPQLSIACTGLNSHP